MPFENIEKRKEYYRRYREKNKEKVYLWNRRAHCKDCNKRISNNRDRCRRCEVERRKNDSVYMVAFKERMSKRMCGKNNPRYGIQGEFMKERNRKFGNPMSGTHHTEEAKQKLRENAKNNPNYGMKGRKFSEEHIKKLSGENNHGWLGGKSFEPYTLEFNNQFKNAIRKRDNQVCMNCGIHREKVNRALSVHHVNYDKQLNMPENCIILCLRCHALTNFNREYWTKLFQEKLSKFYDYKYDKKGNVILNLTKSNETS